MSAAKGIAGAALFCTACSLLVDSGGLSDDDPQANDAGVTEAAVADVTVTGDGGVAGDADASGDAAYVEPCVGNVVLCEKFDSTNATDVYEKTLDPNTRIDTDDSAFLSAPRSARFTIDPSTSIGSADATLNMHPTAALADFSIEGRVFIEKREPNEDGRLFWVNGATGGEALFINASGAVKNGTSAVNVGMFASGKWIHLRVEIHAGAAPAQATIEVDGTKFPYTLTLGWPAGAISIRLGISETDVPTTGWLVRWDDVVVKKL